MVKLVMGNQADVSASTLTVNSQRSKVVTFTELYTDKIRLVYKRHPVHSMSTYKIVFSTETWLLFGISIAGLWLGFAAYSNFSIQKNISLSRAISGKTLHVEQIK